LTAALPPLNFLTRSPGFTDYRPVVNSTGDAVVFERTPYRRTPFAPTTLYQITDFSAPNVVPFLSGRNAPGEQTRPDWSWTTLLVAFNGSAYPSATTVWQAQWDGSRCQEIPHTEGFYYPTWSRDGSLLVTENQRRGAEGDPLPPRNSIFDLAGELTHEDIDGVDSAETKVFGGMPTVGPNLPQIAFAGQPQLVGWGEPVPPPIDMTPVYNQDKNYIFLNSVVNGAYTSVPMETSASVTTYDKRYQGRAPAWSPDGNKIAFESNRNGGYAIYLCDLGTRTRTITQVTDPSLGGQHAKFFPCGTKLILCIHHPGGEPETMGIAWVDISGLLMA